LLLYLATLLFAIVALLHSLLSLLDLALAPFLHPPTHSMLLSFLCHVALVLAHYYLRLLFTSYYSHVIVFMFMPCCSCSRTLLLTPCYSRSHALLLIAYYFCFRALLILFLHPDACVLLLLFSHPTTHAFCSHSCALLLVPCCSHLVVFALMPYCYLSGTSWTPPPIVVSLHCCSLSHFNVLPC
jgi:hypothetical protein